LFRDIEDRWNRGAFGREYDECDDYNERRRWDKQLGLGREKIFEVRKIYNDVTFIDTFLTDEFCQQHKLFVYQYDLDEEQFVIASREFGKIKRQLLNQLTNAGQPIISVVDADFGNRGELCLEHTFEGVPLDLHFAEATLVNLQKIWKKPVSIRSVYQSKQIMLRHDGEQSTIEEIAESSSAAGD
ncbi:MAG TPA: SpoVR family protein, partial [Candidatus Krumholzibacteria bacterium]